MKTALAGMGAVAAVGCAMFGVVGCGNKEQSPSQRLNALADDFALALMGDDIFGWNAFSVTPGRSFGYTRYGEPSWYSFSQISDSDASDVLGAFGAYKSMLETIDFDKLSNADASTYRSMENVLDTYIDYYGSGYAREFDLIGGDYISDEGGYVSSFATTFENFELRSERDVKDLIAVTNTTDDAFITYLDYAQARIDAGFPLYDCTVNSMIDYLDAVKAQGSNYYLYDVAANKIENASFLSDTVKTKYKNQMKAALDNGFMTGVRTLAAGLDEFTGNVVDCDVSYLGAYGEVGKAYYEWMFAQKTGERGVELDGLYDELFAVYMTALDREDAIIEKAAALEQTAPEEFTEFSAYMEGEKELLGLETPQEVLDYLKVAAKKIVPDLKTEPDIGFKYMNPTEAERSSTLAYYMSTPLDDLGATEHITLNGYLLEQGSTGLLPLMAHEGYPGHLYAYVNAKENGTKLISAVTGCTAFSEGWAQYTALAVLNNIAEEEGDSAAGLYAEYSMMNMYEGYLSSLLMDMQINYFGRTAQDYVQAGATDDIEQARMLIQAFMGIPAMYVPYGYGMWVMTGIHDSTKEILGDKYDAPEFNGMLLGDGMAPTLARAKEIATEYIAKKSAE